MERICWFSLRYNKISMVSCNQAVNSENYADFIYRYGNISLELIRQQTGTDCISYVDEEYVILHAPLDQVLPITLARYSLFVHSGPLYPLRLHQYGAIRYSSGHAAARSQHRW